MKKNLKIFVLIFSLAVPVQTNCKTEEQEIIEESFNKTFESIEKGFSKAFKAIGEFAKGLPKMFYDKCPKNSLLNAMVINDINQKTHTTIGASEGVFGMEVKTATVGREEIDPYSWIFLKNIRACHIKFGLETIDPESGKTLKLLEKKEDIPENDKTIHYYHTFTLNNRPQGEFMGPGYFGGPYIPTKKFEGVFFNNTDQDVKLNFKKNDQEFTVTLEKKSFNTLNSDPEQEYQEQDSQEQESPKNKKTDINLLTEDFIFETADRKVIKIPVPLENPAQIYKIKKENTEKQEKQEAETAKTEMKEINIPLTKTYEIYKDKTGSSQVGIQGFNAGNHNPIGILDIEKPEQEKLAPVRNINPVKCIIDCKLEKDAFYTEQLWVIYQTSDTKIQKKIIPGKKNSFFLIRPQTRENPIKLDPESGLSSQGKANLYILSINTQEDILAKTLINDILEEKKLEKLIRTGPEIELTEISPIKISLTDKKNQVTGKLVLVDTFLSYGGQLTTKKYTVFPATLKTDDFVANIANFLDIEKFKAKNINIETDLRKNIYSWFKSFGKIKPEEKKALNNLSKIDVNKNKIESLLPKLTKYFKEYGAKSLFDQNGEFTKLGTLAIFSILFGPISLSTPPITQQAGQNTYLYTGGEEKNQKQNNNKTNT